MIVSHTPVFGREPPRDIEVEEAIELIRRLQHGFCAS